MWGKIIGEVRDGKYFSLLRVCLTLTYTMLLSFLVKGQSETIIFHNCENFFYPTKDSLTKDDDYTSSSLRHWTMDRFNAKKDLLAKTYVAISQSNLPAIIGLSEVENNQVLEALCNDSPLRKGNYAYIHYDSKDIRGIDVAMIYRKDKFKVLQQENISTEHLGSEPTRDVLYVKGLLNDMPLNLFVIHAPSRRNQNVHRAMRTEVFRLVYKRVKTLYDSGEKNIIIMGDMNDNPWDKTVVSGFQTARYAHHEPLLVNLMQNDKGKRYSYCFIKETFNFDQFLVTEELRENIDTTQSSSHVFSADFLIDKNPKLPLAVPFSTYKGYRYQGGASDHFPIYLRLNTQKSR